MLRFRVVAIGLMLVGLGGAALAGTDDRGAAEAALSDVSASPKAAVAAELTRRAHAALDRATQLRVSGDDSHARLAEAAARAWAETARDTVKAATVEAVANRSRVDANEAGVIADRERALLEEAVAQNGRLRAQLEAAPNKDKDLPARTSAQASSDAGVSSRDAKKQTPKRGGGPPVVDNLDGGAP